METKKSFPQYFFSEKDLQPIHRGNTKPQYTNIEQVEPTIWKHYIFIITRRKMKYLGVNLTKQAQWSVCSKLQDAEERSKKNL